MKCMLILFYVMILLEFKFCENKFITCNSTTKRILTLKYAHEMNILYIYIYIFFLLSFICYKFMFNTFMYRHMFITREMFLN